jgi:putative ABC transport system substrate-binding protein
MRRRRFLSGLGFGAALVSIRPRAAAAQAAIPTVGLLALGLPDPARWFSGMQTALGEIGYVPGRTVRIEARSGGGDHHRLSEMAAELVRRDVDVIVARQTPASIAARDATTKIPIIMSGVGDPVGTGLIASLSHPGGNVTGMSAASPGLAGKLVDIVRELLPAARRLAVLLNGADPYSRPLREQIEIGADLNRMKVDLRLARPEDDFEAMLGLMRQNGADALFIQPTLVSKALVDLALRYRLPTVSNSGAALGVLAVLSPSAKELERGTADYVDKILKGRRPAELPVSQPTTFELGINNKTAQTLGLEIPPSVLARADEVIE